MDHVDYIFCGIIPGFAHHVFFTEGCRGCNRRILLRGQCKKGMAGK